MNDTSGQWTQPGPTDAPVNNLVIISDIHSGCRMALYPPDNKLLFDAGIRFLPSLIQLKLWAHWRHFLDEWLPKVTKGEPFDLVHNGDAVNGKPFNTVANLTGNPAEQRKISRAVLEPVRRLPQCRKFYMIKGTEVHVEKSGSAEETLAEELDATPDEYGQFARYDLWKRIGPVSAHILHHIGTTSSAAYETTAVQSELVSEFHEAGRWGYEPPMFVVRSHRHRFCETGNPSRFGMAKGIVTPGWQAKTPFIWRIPGGRVAPPQFGGIVIRHGDEDQAYSRFKVYTMDRSKMED